MAVPSVTNHPARHVDCLTGHVVRLARGKKSDHARHVLGLLRTTERDGSDAFLPVLARLFPKKPDANVAVDLLPHLRIDQARAHAVHPQAIFRAGRREAARQT